MVTGFLTERHFAGIRFGWGMTLLCALIVCANGAEVVITSDPPGSVISAGGKELGITPLTLDLPSGQPVEIISRFGPLGPLTQTLTPSEGQIVAYQFKHEYGTLVVTCERIDAALVIDGTGYGHPPAVVLVSPGRHKLFLTASNAPDKTREVELKAGERATVEMNFSGGSPETTKASVEIAEHSGGFTVSGVYGQPEPEEPRGQAGAGGSDQGGLGGTPAFDSGRD